MKMSNNRHFFLPLMCVVAVALITSFAVADYHFDEIECGNFYDGSYCVDAGTLQIEGANFTIAIDTVLTLNEENNITCKFQSSYSLNTLKCQLGIPSTVPNGPYPIHITLNDTDKTVIRAGNIIVGYVYNADLDTWNDKAPLPDGIKVDGQSSIVLENGTDFVIKGSFDKNDVYAVKFYSITRNNDDVPTCYKTITTENTITCTVKAEKIMLHNYSFLVFDQLKDNFVPMSQKLPALHVKNPPPELYSITCSGGSSLCTDSSVVSLNGKNLNTFIEDTSITLNDKYGITCSVYGSYNSFVYCYLHLAKPIPDGPYPLVINVDNDDHTVINAGNMLIGEYYNSHNKFKTWNNNQAPTKGITAQSQSTPELKSGADFTVHGTFDPTRKYNVQFFATEYTSRPIPECSTDAITATSITCKVSANSSMINNYKFLVQDVANDVFVPMAATMPELFVTLPDPVITSASGKCASSSASCVSNTYLTLIGTNFNDNNYWYNEVKIVNRYDDLKRVQCALNQITTTEVRCELKVDDNAFAGQYAITFVGQINVNENTTGEIAAGYLNLGLGTSQAGWQNQFTPALDYHIATVSPSQVHDGAAVTINGKFNPKGNYEVVVSRANLSSTALPGDLATCNLVSTSATAITCVYIAEQNTSGVWFVNVRDVTSQLYVPFNWKTANPVTLIAVTPEVTGARGQCAKDSTACYSGAYLTLTGSYFNTTSPQNNKVSFVNADAGLLCDMKSVGPSYVSCELTVPPHLTGAYAIELSTKLSDNSWLTPPVTAGVLVLGAASNTPGWKISQGDDIIIRNSSSGLTPVMKVCIALVVCFAVCLIVLSLIFVYVCCKYRLIKKARATNAESKQLNNRREPTNTSGSYQKKVDNDDNGDDDGNNQHYGMGKVVNHDAQQV